MEDAHGYEAGNRVPESEARNSRLSDPSSRKGLSLGLIAEARECI